MTHYCPACHSTEKFTLESKAEVVLLCDDCGHRFRIESVLRKCPACKHNQPHAEHRREGKFHKQEVFAYTCLSCGHYEELDDGSK